MNLGDKTPAQYDFMSKVSPSRFGGESSRKMDSSSSQKEASFFFFFGVATVNADVRCFPALSYPSRSGADAHLERVLLCITGELTILLFENDMFYEHKGGILGDRMLLIDSCSSR